MEQNPLRVAIFGTVIVGIGIITAWLLLAGHATATMAIRVPATSVAVGSPFTAEVFLDAGTYEATAADITITYDETKFQAVSIAPGPLMPTQLAGGMVGSGTAVIAVGSGTKPVSGGGVVALLTLVARTSGTGTIALEKSTQAAAVGVSKNIIGTLTPATVTVR